MSIFLFLALIGFSNFHGCALAPDGVTGYVVTLDTVVILKTVDGGLTWVRIPTTASRKFFDVTTTDGIKVWTCGILGEIMYSSDGGNTWSMQVTGVSKYLTRIEFYDSLYGWAVGGDGVIARTVDGGSYWYQYFTPFYLAEFYGVSFLDTSVVFAVAGWPDNFETGQGYICLSMDGGRNWELLKQSSGYEDYLDVQVVNDSVIVVVGGNDMTLEPIILRSVDRGLSWDSITSIPSDAHYLRAVDFVGEKGWAVGRRGTILYTEDGGLSWVKQYSPADSTLFDIDFSDELHGIACGYNHIIYTTDGGQTWQSGMIAGIEERFRESLKVKLSSSFMRKSLMIEIKGIYEKPVKVEIFDTNGRILRSWDILTDETCVVWDGCDGKGRMLKSGVYFVSIKLDGEVVYFGGVIKLN